MLRGELTREIVVAPGKLTIGKRQVRMRVPYLGYLPLERDAKPKAEDESLAPIDAWDARREPHANGTEEDETGFTF